MDILEELFQDKESDPGETIAEALASLAQRRGKAIALNVRVTINDVELDEELDQVNREWAGGEARLAELTTVPTEPEPPLDADLLVELRRRLNQELDDYQRQEMVQLLVKRITVHT